MLRRFLGFVSLLPLLSGGCVGARAPLPENRPETPPAAHAAKKLPASLVPTHLPAPKSSPITLVAEPKDSKWGEFVQQPAAPPPVKPDFPAVTVSPPPDRPVETPKHPIVLAVECLLDNRHQEAEKHLQVYDAQTQEFLLRVLPTLALVGRSKTLAPADINALTLQVASLRDYLQLVSEFSVSKLSFCESITGYAIYQPLPADHAFIAAQPDRPGELIQLYVEIKNFGNRPNQGLFETHLASHIEIRDDKGQTKWLHRFRPDDLKLVSRTRLGEYYHNYAFTLPPSLPPGSYSLTVEITDQTRPEAPRTARSALPLQIVNPKN